ncbi:MAG: MYG1 family protein [Bacillota bacterium]|nr:MYG1 family protein [Bacillota bacterium]
MGNVLKKVIKAGTHNGSFHADDVNGWVLVKELWPDAALVRTRDKSVLETCDLVFDVGGGKFDHHKEDREKRENGIYYSGAGLLWRDFGEIIIKKYAPGLNNMEVKNAVEKFDEDFLLPICAEDNGQKLYNSEYKIKTYSDVIGEFNPTFNEGTSEDEAFYNAASFAKFIFRKEIKKAVSYIERKEVIREALDNRKIPEILILDRRIPWKDALMDLDKNEEVLYTIYPTDKGTFMIQAVPKQADSFENRKDLPAKWGRVSDEDFEETTKVKGSIFCHANLFLAGAETIEGAVQLAEIAVSA